MAEINKTFKIKQGDLLPVLRGRIFDVETGDGQDLTGAALEFHMRYPDAGEIVVSAPAEIDGDQNLEAEKGMWRYEWQAGDTGPYSETDTIVFDGEIQATFAGKPLTAPNDSHFKVKMKPELD